MSSTTSPLTLTLLPRLASDGTPLINAALHAAGYIFTAEPPLSILTSPSALQAAAPPPALIVSPKRRASSSKGTRQAGFTVKALANYNDALRKRGHSVGHSASPRSPRRERLSPRVDVLGGAGGELMSPPRGCAGMFAGASVGGSSSCYGTRKSTGSDGGTRSPAFTIKTLLECDDGPQRVDRPPTPTTPGDPVFRRLSAHSHGTLDTLPDPILRTSSTPRSPGDMGLRQASFTRDTLANMPEGSQRVNRPSTPTTPGGLFLRQASFTQHTLDTMPEGPQRVNRPSTPTSTPGDACLRRQASFTRHTLETMPEGPQRVNRPPTPTSPPCDMGLRQASFTKHTLETMPEGPQRVNRPPTPTTPGGLILRQASFTKHTLDTMPEGPQRVNRPPTPTSPPCDMGLRQASFTKHTLETMPEGPQRVDRPPTPTTPGGLMLRQASFTKHTLDTMPEGPQRVDRPPTPTTPGGLILRQASFTQHTLENMPEGPQRVNRPPTPTSPPCDMGLRQASFTKHTLETMPEGPQRVNRPSTPTTPGGLMLRQASFTKHTLDTMPEGPQRVDRPPTPTSPPCNMVLHRQASFTRDTLETMAEGPQRVNRPSTPTTPGGLTLRQASFTKHTLDTMPEGPQRVDRPSTPTSPGEVGVRRTPRAGPFKSPMSQGLGERHASFTQKTLDELREGPQRVNRPPTPTTPGGGGGGSRRASFTEPLPAPQQQQAQASSATANKGVRPATPTSGSGCTSSRRHGSSSYCTAEAEDDAGSSSSPSRSRGPSKPTTPRHAGFTVRTLAEHASSRCSTPGSQFLVEPRPRQNSTLLSTRVLSLPDDDADAESFNDSMCSRRNSAASRRPSFAIKTLAAYEEGPNRVDRPPTPASRVVSPTASTATLGAMVLSHYVQSPEDSALGNSCRRGSCGGGEGRRPSFSVKTLAACVEGPQRVERPSTPMSARNGNRDHAAAVASTPQVYAHAHTHVHGTSHARGAYAGMSTTMSLDGDTLSRPPVALPAAAVSVFGGGVNSGSSAAGTSPYGSPIALFEQPSSRSPMPAQYYTGALAQDHRSLAAHVEEEINELSATTPAGLSTPSTLAVPAKRVTSAGGHRQCTLYDEDPEFPTGRLTVGGGGGSARAGRRGGAPGGSGGGVDTTPRPSSSVHRPSPPVSPPTRLTRSPLLSSPDQSPRQPMPASLRLRAGCSRESSPAQAPITPPPPMVHEGRGRRASMSGAEDGTDCSAGRPRTERASSVSDRRASFTVEALELQPGSQRVERVSTPTTPAASRMGSITSTSMQPPQRRASFTADADSLPDGSQRVDRLATPTRPMGSRRFSGSGPVLEMPRRSPSFTTETLSPVTAMATASNTTPMVVRQCSLVTVDTVDGPGRVSRSSTPMPICGGHVSPVVRVESMASDAQGEAQQDGPLPPVDLFSPGRVRKRSVKVGGSGGGSPTLSCSLDTAAAGDGHLGVVDDGRVLLSPGRIRRSRQSPGSCASASSPRALSHASVSDDAEGVDGGEAGFVDLVDDTSDGRWAGRRASPAGGKGGGSSSSRPATLLEGSPYNGTSPRGGRGARSGSRSGPPQQLRQQRRRTEPSPSVPGARGGVSSPRSGAGGGRGGRRSSVASPTAAGASTPHRRRTQPANAQAGLPSVASASAAPFGRQVSHDRRSSSVRGGTTGTASIDPGIPADTYRKLYQMGLVKDETPRARFGSFVRKPASSSLR